MGLIDLTGKKFGRLTVVAMADNDADITFTICVSFDTQLSMLERRLSTWN